MRDRDGERDWRKNVSEGRENERLSDMGWVWHLQCIEKEIWREADVERKSEKQKERRERQGRGDKKVKDSIRKMFFSLRMLE